MSQIKNILIKQMNGEVLTDVEQALVDGKDPRTIIEAEWESKTEDLVITFKEEKWMDEEEDLLIIPMTTDEFYEGVSSREADEYWRNLDNNDRCKIASEMFEKRFRQKIGIEPWYTVTFQIVVDGKKQIKLVCGPRNSNWVEMLSNKMKGVNFDILTMSKSF